MGHNGLLIGGAILLLVGILGFAVPIFTTEQTKDVAKIGDLKLQTTESTTHIVPMPVVAGAFVIGIVLLGTGLYQRR